MHNGPDPADDSPGEEALEETEDEGVGVEAILAEASGDHGSPSWGEDVEEEADEVHWWVALDDGGFAGTSSFSGFSGVGHMFCFIQIKNYYLKLNLNLTLGQLIIQMVKKLVSVWLNWNKTKPLPSLTNFLVTNPIFRKLALGVHEAKEDVK